MKNEPVVVRLVSGVQRRLLLDIVIPQLSDGLWESEEKADASWKKLDSATIQMVERNPGSNFKLDKKFDLLELVETIPADLLIAARKFNPDVDLPQIEEALKALQEVLS